MVFDYYIGQLKNLKNNLITDINSGDIWIGPANTPHEYWADENCMFISSALFVEEDFLPFRKKYYT